MSPKSFSPRSSHFGDNQPEITADRDSSKEGGKMTQPEIKQSGSKSKPSIFSSRHASLATKLYNYNLDALALNPGATLTYLTGLQFHLMERPIVALFTPHSPPVLVLPELEAGKTADLPFAIQVFPYGEDPAVWEAAFRQAAHAAKLEDRNIGIEPRQLRVLELRMLESAVETAKFLSAEDCLSELRIGKDQSEIAAMAKAVDIAQRALQETTPGIRIGMTERELASELTLQLLKAGSDPNFPFSPIVSAGPNSANPHAVPGERTLQEGDLLVIDFGAIYSGYISDITRTFAVGEVQPELAKIAKIVKEANAAGRTAIRPGVAAQEVDRATRSVIEAAGYGSFFIHRTGHGIGMEGHEAPYIRQGNLQKLEVGMTFTIEPGIYLPGRGGVRIEDNVVVTEHGVETLTNLPRGLATVGK
jgi:Xaa-Pro dipeptidase